MSPSSIFAVVAPGGVLSREITVIPSSPAATRVTVSVEGFTLDADGLPVRGQHVVDAQRTARLTASPRTFVLESGRSQKVTLRCAVDDAAQGSYWAVALLEVEPVRQVGEDGRAVNVVARLAVPVFLTIEGASHPDLKIGELRAVPAADGRVDAEAMLENVGDSVVRVSGAWALEENGPGGSVEVASSDVKEVVVLPGAPRRLRATLAAPGTDGRARLVLLLLRYGPGKGQTASARLPVPPLNRSAVRSRPARRLRADPREPVSRRAQTQRGGRGSLPGRDPGHRAS